MFLSKINYSEYHGEKNFWELQECIFKDSNFIVGKNSTGKSRTVSVIFNLAKLISGEIDTVFETGKYNVELVDNIKKTKKKWTYTVEFKESKVYHEKITFNKKTILERNEDGSGKVFYESINESLDIKLPNNQMAINKYQDEIQQLNIFSIVEWAKQTIRINFGSDLGQTRFLTKNAIEKISFSEKSIANGISEQYIIAYKKFGSEFDASLKKDMKLLGYNLIDVEFGPTNLKAEGVFESVFGLSVIEDGLDFKNVQMHISQGMYRALATLISINFMAMRKEPATLIIDDIGEGLDFQRSTELIKIILAKSKKSKIQVIMTSNDQFVMNVVPLKDWIILKRNKNIVTPFNYTNSKEKFDKFEFVGLNNFEFFSLGLFEKEF